MDLGNLSSYIELGFRHILPEGVDHILFIVAMFLSARGWGQLLIQVSAFTLSHTITLGLTAADILNVDGRIVEPLIALSIALVGLDAAFTQKMRPWRLPVIFAFGLFHGMGFGDAMHDMFVGVDFATVLVGCYLGVELGQLTVLAGAFAVSTGVKLGLKAANREALYRRVFVQPVAIAIALFGLWWFLERLGLFGPVG
jgi:hypothetical protein